ncbi:tyrosine-protein phosphatase [Streptacidiphilus carbonis]|jgi:protein-tyrosine phosphatase|uniref:tyrosine-protein phosphatase n=1 Tax=Streptacidiphilus carbonis TaxID=105422 RepID=UPI000B01C905|nr:tyrosine-protein phosphatase [Streptacidiphilus carbonis]
METTQHQQPAGGPPPGADRLIDVPGVRNLRDAGGFATADGGRIGLGLLYRSASLCELSPDGAKLLAALGLRTVVDLRSAEELVHWPNQRHGLDFELVSLPTLPPLEGSSADPETAADVSERHRQEADPQEADPQDDGMTGMYAYMAETAGPPIVACIRQLIAPGALPALVHCAVGKDRTGVTIAVVLSALGVADADITADFALSNAGLGLLDGPVHYVDEHGVQRPSRPVRTELLALFLRKVHSRYGTTAGFLRYHGLTEGELARLRRLLVEKV